MPNQPITELLTIAGIDQAYLNDYTEEVQRVSRLKLAINQSPDKNANTYYKILGVSKNDLTRYFQILEINSPGLVTIDHLEGTKRYEDICTLKKQAAVNMAAGTMTDKEIVKDLGIPLEDVQRFKTTLPAITPKMPGYEILKKENRIREFFDLYPYSTITEAAKALRMGNKEIRVIIEDLTRYGEVIKYNNSPRPLEYEKKKLDVVNLKKNDPTLSEKEISETLGISIHQVRQAMADTIRLWQMEKVQAYEFYSHKTMTELEEVKRLTIERHKAANNSSSRWMEIYLQAIEKQINMLGLKAPERVDINKNVTVTKEHRDQIVNAFMATETIDVDFEKIEVTGTEN